MSDIESTGRTRVVLLIISICIIILSLISIIVSIIATIVSYIKTKNCKPDDKNCDDVKKVYTRWIYRLILSGIIFVIFLIISGTIIFVNV